MEVGNCYSVVKETYWSLCWKWHKTNITYIYYSKSL